MSKPPGDMSHQIGAGPTSSVGGAIRADGQTDYGPESVWGTEPIQRVKNKMADEAEPQVEEKVGPVKAVPLSPASPEAIDAEWIRGYFQTGGFVVAGLRVAPGLPAGKGWRLAAQDGRYLYLVSGEAFAKGLEQFVAVLRKEAFQAQLTVFPKAMENLLDDPNIGPMVSMMMTLPQPVVQERVDDPQK